MHKYSSYHQQQQEKIIHKQQIKYPYSKPQELLHVTV